MTLSEKYRPRNLNEYGLTQSVTLTDQFLCDWPRRGKALLLFGPPGTGKTTLAYCAAKQLGWSIIESNTSLVHDKRFFERLTDVSLTKGLTSSKQVILLDEADNLNASAQKAVQELIKKTRNPIILTCNNPRNLGEGLRRTCGQVVVPKPMKDDLRSLAERVLKGEHLDVSMADRVAQRARTYRDVFSIIAGGDSFPEEVQDDPTERIKMLLMGKDVQLEPSEIWMVPAWILDNTKDLEALEFDKWRLRYQKAGKIMEKYVQRSARLFVMYPRWPWSVRFKAAMPKEKVPPKHEEPKTSTLDAYF